MISLQLDVHAMHNEKDTLIDIQKRSQRFKDSIHGGWALHI